MYLHLGGDVVVRDCSIVGIFDLERASVSRQTREFLSATNNDSVVTVSYDMPRSFVLCNEDGKDVIYITAISAATLKLRYEK